MLPGVVVVGSAQEVPGESVLVWIDGAAGEHVPGEVSGANGVSVVTAVTPPPGPQLPPYLQVAEGAGVV